MKTRIHDKQIAINLRKKGYSIREISKSLHISKGSISPWVKNVKLSKTQKIRLINNEKNSSKIFFDKNGYYPNKEYTEKCKKLRENFQIKGYELAEQNEDFRLLCALYWGEGAKGKMLFALQTVIQIFCEFLLF